MPRVAFWQSGQRRRSSNLKSSAALGSNSGALISTPRTHHPSDFRRRTRWWPMNPPAPVTKMRGFPCKQTPGVSDWEGEALFYRTLSSPGKLTLGFEKGKEKSAMPKQMCKSVHPCVNVLGTKEP